jgi:hypothetical protein
MQSQKERQRLGAMMGKISRIACGMNTSPESGASTQEPTEAA